MLSEPRLARRITWNLKLVRISNHFVIVKSINSYSHSDSKIGSNFSSVLAKLAKLLSSAKLWIEAFGIKNKKSLKKILNKIGPKIEPWATPDMNVSSSLCSLFFEHNAYNLLNKNRCSKANHYLAHMLRVLSSVSHLVCSQKL